MYYIIICRNIKKVDSIFVEKRNCKGGLVFIQNICFLVTALLEPGFVCKIKKKYIIIIIWFFRYFVIVKSTINWFKIIKEPSLKRFSFIIILGFWKHALIRHICNNLKSILVVFYLNYCCLPFSCSDFLPVFIWALRGWAELRVGAIFKFAASWLDFQTFFVSSYQR